LECRYFLLKEFVATHEIKIGDFPKLWLKEFKGGKEGNYYWEYRSENKCRKKTNANGQ